MVKYPLSTVSFPYVSSLSRIMAPWVLAALAVWTSMFISPDS